MLTAVLKNITALSGRVSAGCVKHPAWWLAALFVLSLGLKVAVWCYDPVIGRDAATYLHTTKEWAETGVMPQSWIPPMLFCLIRIGMFFGLDPEMAGVSINLLLGALITPVGCGIAYEITRNKKIALITAVFLYHRHECIYIAEGEVVLRCKTIPCLYASCKNSRCGVD